MSDLTPGQRRALQYWGPIEHGTLAGENTAQIWQRIRDQAAALGYDTPGVGARDIAYLRSQAVGIRTARDQLERAGEQDLITGEMIGSVPWSRGLASQNVVPKWQVRFEHNIVVDGRETTVWRTSMFTGSIPRSRRELETDLNADAANLAREYEVGNAGIGAYHILAV
jgi:hypothetical protein